MDGVSLQSVMSVDGEEIPGIYKNREQDDA